VGIGPSRVARTCGATRASAASARRRGARLATCGLAACAALLIGAGPAQAVNYVVNSTGDGSDVTPGNGVCATASATCTLRAAMQDAQALGGTNTITLLGLPDPSTIDLFSALPTISGQTLTITGRGQHALTVRRAAGGDYSIFTSSVSDVSISGMTITNGRALAPNGIVQGGGIYSFAGSLELDDVAVVGNAAAGEGFAQGGGIYKEQGTLTIRDSTISQNSVLVTSNGALLGLGGLGLGGGISAVLVTDFEVANSTIGQNSVSVTGLGGVAARGGGISVSANTIEIVDSTVSTNSATAGSAGTESAEVSGGGIEAFGATFSLIRSTVDHNFATAAATSAGSLVLGGGIYVSGTAAVNVTSSTISTNTATGGTANDVVAGGGLRVLDGALTISGSTLAFNAAPQGANLSDAADSARLRNTILADPQGGGANCLEAVPNSLASDGYNLASDASCQLTGPGDQPNTNPLLLPLADNGGPTRTHALTLASPAVDKGNAAPSGAHPALTTDQRGRPRPADQPLIPTAADGTDVGAFELKAGARPPSQPAVVRNSTNWLLRDSLTTGDATRTFSYGSRPSVPLTGDWDGNGTRTAGTFAGGVFSLRNGVGGGDPEVTFAFGDARGFPVAADFNGDGSDDVAVYRGGVWQVRYSTGVTLPAFSFGSGSWPATVPVAGDWDGDGNAGIGTYTYATATWKLRNTVGAGVADIGPFVYGTPNASYPVVGDWDGDGDDTIGTWVSGSFFLKNTLAGGAADIVFDFGSPNDLPLTWRQGAAPLPPP
jgi:CSLREA domain-containing protein